MRGLVPRIHVFGRKWRRGWPGQARPWRSRRIHRHARACPAHPRLAGAKAWAAEASHDEFNRIDEWPNFKHSIVLRY